MGNPSSVPAAANPARTYQQSLAANVNAAPRVARAELGLRAQYDASHVGQSLDRQQQQGTGFTNLYRDVLAGNNPGAQAVQKQLGTLAGADLAKGYSLDPEQLRAVQQQARAGQVGTGNVLGNAAVAGEARAVGIASFSAHQQRLKNAENSLAVDNALKEYTAAAGLLTSATTPDRSASYVQPQAGNTFQALANKTYQQDVAFAQYYSANINQFLGPWQRTLQGAYIGAREGYQGGSFVSPVIGAWGALGGAVFGALDGAANGPIYQWNVNSSGYAIYGVPWQSTAISAGAAAVSGYVGASLGGSGASFGELLAAGASQAAISAASQAGENYYRYGGG